MKTCFEKDFESVYNNVYKNKSMKRTKRNLWGLFCMVDPTEKKMNKNYIVTLKTSAGNYYIYNASDTRILVYHASEGCIGYFDK